MLNTTMTVEGDKLIITVDLKGSTRPSSTGKTRLVGTTAGAVAVDYAKLPGLKAAVNVTIPA